MIMKKLYDMGEYSAAGLYENTDRSLFYRKSIGLKRYFENCPIPQYNGELLYPSGKNFSPDYQNGLAFSVDNIAKKDGELAQIIRNDFFKYHSTVPREHEVAGNMWTHSMPNYERILKEGFASYKLRIEKIEDKEIREGLLNLIEGINCYLVRCVNYLESVNAKPELIEALKKVPMKPCENIYEAVVCWNFILYLDNCDNLGCVDSGLMPYYNGEDITELLENLYDNLDAKEGYSMALHTDYNPLTLQCLEAAKGKRRPMIELFVDENTPDEIWKKAFEVVRTQGGQPAFYNPHVLLDGLKNRFKNIREEDIKKFCGGGCTEAMIAGFSNVGSLDAGINLLLILENSIKNILPLCNDFEEFYGKYINAVKEVVNEVTDEIGNSRRQRAEYNPVPMRTLLIDDCIDSGVEYNHGGARYNWSIVNFAGMINIIDSLLVIRDFIFRDKSYTSEEFIKLLSDNDEEFLNKCKKYKTCFGIDDKEVNAFSNRISSEIFSTLDGKEVPFGEGFLPASIQFKSQVGAGLKIGATPDGRKAGSPLCDSLGAIFGKDVKGATALLKSVTSLELNKALGVPVLNLNINPDFKDEVLKGLILGYMKLGGIQLQITCISRETLEKALENPDDYRNLVVRVGGFSEYYSRLSYEMKVMILNRTIQSEV